jgi:hypothetical protein
VHTAAFVHQWLVKHNIQVLPSTLFSPDVASAGFHFLPKVKDHLRVITLTQDTFKSIWEQVIMTLTSEEFAAAYRRLLEQN